MLPLISAVLILHLSFLTPTHAIPILGFRSPAADPTSLEAITDQLLYSTPLPTFLAARNARDPPTLDWSSNGCTLSPDKPFGNDFTGPCQRHDFGYHNTKIQGRFADQKDRIDENFYEDMKGVCDGVEELLKKGACEAAAGVYYEAVKAFGGLAEAE